MMRNFATGFLVCALLFTSMGAMQQQDELQKAYVGFQTEAYVDGVLRGIKADAARIKASRDRREHWLSIIEKFTP